MLTVRFDKLPVGPGSMFLDAGAGFGRHAFEAARRGARVVALDYAEEETTVTRATFAAMFEAGEIKSENLVAVLRGDATRLPFADNTFDCIVTSEVLEHIQNDVAALHELSRVLKPGGVLAATVPSWFPEKINWMLSDEYHAPFVQGGHVRIGGCVAQLAQRVRTINLSTPTKSFWNGTSSLHQRSLGHSRKCWRLHLVRATSCIRKNQDAHRDISWSSKR